MSKVHGNNSSDLVSLNEYYRLTASKYDLTRYPWKDGPLGSIEQEVMLKFLSKGSILECGVGTGRYAQELGWDRLYVGCDISREMISICRKNLKSRRMAANLVIADAQNLPFAADTFDYLLCGRSFKFYPDSSKFLQDAARCLRNPGKCIISLASRDSLLFGLAIRLRLIKLRNSSKQTHERYYRFRQVVHLAKKAGFSKSNTIPVGNVLFGLYSFVWFHIYDSSLNLLLKSIPERLVRPLLRIGRETQPSYILIVAEKLSQGYK